MAATTMSRLLRTPNVLIFLISGFISSIGDFALWLAMAIWLKELTGSSGAAGITFFFFGCGALLSPLGGLVADRFRRRRLLIVVNVVAAGPVLLLTFVHHSGQAWLVYSTMFILGAIGTVLSAAGTALLPLLVPPDGLGPANGLRQTLNELIRLFAPVLGAGLFTLVGGPVIAEIDAATFLIAAIGLALVRVDEPKPQPRKERWSTEMSAGTRFLARTPALRQLTIALGCVVLVFGFTESINFSVVTAGLRHSASFIGVLLAVQGAAGVAGALMAGPLLNRYTERQLVVAGLALAIASPLLVAVPNLPTVLVGFAIGGIALPWILVAATTALQRRSPREILGRVSGAFDLVLTLPQVTSIGVGAALIAIVGYRDLLFVIAAVMALAAIYLGTRRDERIEPAEPEAEADPLAGPEPHPVTGPEMG
jgi:MFS family permease